MFKKLSFIIRRATPKSCYISGKISNIDYNEALENFEFYESLLESKGYIPVNPLVVSPFSIFKKWRDYMYDDILALFRCEYAFFMSNWKDSRGARIEYRICKILFIKIIVQPIKSI